MRDKVYVILLLALVACSPLASLDETSAKGTAYEVSVTSPRPVDENTISIAIAVDTSGSMVGEKIKELKRAMYGTIEKFGSYKGKRLEVGLYEFASHTETLVPMGTFNPQALRNAVDGLGTGGNTGIGRALAYAERELDASATGVRNILLLTDGENTSGRSPEEVLAYIADTNRESGDAYTSVYVIGFDMDASYFAPMASLGAMVEPSAKGQLIEVMVGNIKRMVEAEP